MFHNAVKNHNASAAAAAAATSPSRATFKQVSHGSSFNHSSAVQKHTTHSLAEGARQNGQRASRSDAYVPHGIKRTSSGLAKHLGSQEDVFNYPTMNIAALEKENSLPPSFHAPSRTSSTSLASALFDDDDFDSDVDLDVEDPATKGTVTYPTLHRERSFDTSISKDSSYKSRATSAQSKPELDSSQPIPWSSSPLEHFKSPPKPAPPKTKRRQLPWTQVSKLQPAAEVDDRTEYEDETPKVKKVKQAEPIKTLTTPAPKGSVTQYAWNTTASAVKEQQRTFKEKQKTLKEVAAQSRTVQSTEDDMEKAIKRKKKNTVHRIFLSEEQQQVLNLVTEYKKSVFFTGSAGMSVGISRYSSKAYQY